MYVCLDCGIVFATPKHYIEKHGFNDGPYEHLTCCPICGGAYVETIMCDICGEYITDKYAKLDNGMTVCNNCYIEKNIFDGDVV